LRLILRSHSIFEQVQKPTCFFEINSRCSLTWNVQAMLPLVSDMEMFDFGQEMVLLKMNSLSDFREHHFRCLQEVCNKIYFYIAVVWPESKASLHFTEFGGLDTTLLKHYKLSKLGRISLTKHDCFRAFVDNSNEPGVQDIVFSTETTNVKNQNNGIQHLVYF
jgi:hypothetical protein